jgi:hypothetical protein
VAVVVIGVDDVWRMNESIKRHTEANEAIGLILVS